MCQSAIDIHCLQTYREFVNVNSKQEWQKYTTLSNTIIMIVRIYFQLLVHLISYFGAVM